MTKPVFPERRTRAGSPSVQSREARSGVAAAGLRKDARACTRGYAALCRGRILRHLPKNGERLLYLGADFLDEAEERELDRRFRTRYCIDASPEALDKARRTIGDRGVFLNGAFAEIALEDGFFDGAISLRAVDRMDPASREAAIRKLIRITRPGGAVVIATSRPPRFARPRRVLRARRRPARPAEAPAAVRGTVPGRGPSWYRRFGDVARVKIRPGRSLDDEAQTHWIPDTRLGGRLLRVLYRLEESFPHVFAAAARHPLVVLTRSSAARKPVPDGYPPVHRSEGRPARRLFI